MSTHGPTADEMWAIHAVFLAEAVRRIALTSPALAFLYEEFAEMRSGLWGIWSSEPLLTGSVTKSAREHVRREREFYYRVCVRHEETHGRMYRGAA